MASGTCLPPTWETWTECPAPGFSLLCLQEYSQVAWPGAQGPPSPALAGCRAWMGPLHWHPGRSHYLEPASLPVYAWEVGRGPNPHPGGGSAQWQHGTTLAALPTCPGGLSFASLLRQDLQLCTWLIVTLFSLIWKTKCNLLAARRTCRHSTSRPGFVSWSQAAGAGRARLPPTGGFREQVGGAGRCAGPGPPQGSPPLHPCSLPLPSTTFCS